MKKLIAVVACLCLGLALVGCGAKITAVSLEAPVGIKVGESGEIKLKLAFDKDISEEEIAKQKNKLELVWQSSDATVATVDEKGNVTGVEGGNATITATSGTMNATCEITVIVPIKGVKAAESLVLVINGENTARLSAKAVPENANVASIGYESKDKGIATVDADGKVTAIKNGETIITTTMDGLKGETKVIVTTAPTAIKLNSEGGVLYVGGSTIIKATVEPAEANGAVLVWKSSDESIATVKDGVVTAIKTGKATISATTEDGKIKAEYILTVQNKAASTPSKGTGNTFTGSTSGNTGGATTPPTAPPVPTPPPPTEPQHYHGNGSDYGSCPVCGIGYSENIPLDPDAGFDLGGWD